MTKKERLYTIKQVISETRIESQDMLLKILLEKGVEVTQATLSRDIKELQIVKVPTPDKNYSYQLSKSLASQIGETNNLVLYGFINIEFSGNLAVIKTRPGYAMGIASDIDKKITEEIIGTVAGDDTIILVIKENISRSEVLKALSKLAINISDER